MAHRALGQSLFYLGDLTSARVHLEAGVVLYTPQQRTLAARYGTDPAVPCLYYAAHTLWLLGYPERARDYSHTMLMLAQDGADLFSLAAARYFAARLHLLRREPETARNHVEALMTLANEQGFRSLAVYGMILQGSVFSALGQHAEGIAHLRQGLAAHQDVGTEATRPMFLALLATAYAAGGPAEEGLHMVAEALALVERYGVRYYEAELHRLKGFLLLQLADSEVRQAEGCLAQALDIARRQQAKSWELWAAMSLSRLWQRQGKRDAGREILAPIYGWFTEGFDTGDLQEARALLQALS
jgi:predicted ATPase